MKTKTALPAPTRTSAPPAPSRRGRRLRAPVAWYGGKAYYAEWIVGHFPAHRAFVEPFGGAGNILLHKPASEVEVYNDLDGRIVNFFRVLRDRDSLEELQRLCYLTPYSREQFAELAAMPEPAEMVERAWWFFVRCRFALGGLGMSKLSPASWAISLRTRRSMPEPVSKYLSAVEGLAEVAERLRHVAIECLPALRILEKHDREDVLFYCDPPYVPETRHAGNANTYHQEMSLADHETLLAALKRCKAKVAISGYACPLYDRELAGWSRTVLPAKSMMSNSGQAREEVLWMNWPIR